MRTPLSECPEVKRIATTYIQGAEGLKFEKYYDTEGHATIGYGHKLTEREEILLGANLITQEQANELFAIDLAEAINIADEVFSPRAKGINNVRLAVLLEMAYCNGGPELRGFKKTRHYIEQGWWGSAAAEIIDSSWYRTGCAGVQKRIERLAEQMRTGLLIKYPGVS